MGFFISAISSFRGRAYLLETGGQGQMCTSKERQHSRYVKKHVIIFRSLV